MEVLLEYCRVQRADPIYCGWLPWQLLLFGCIGGGGGDGDEVVVVVAVAAVLVATRFGHFLRSCAYFLYR